MHKQHNTLVHMTNDKNTIQLKQKLEHTIKFIHTFTQCTEMDFHSYKKLQTTQMKEL